MNLIEKYGVDAYGLVQRYGGIDKCKEIIENAPEGAECYSWLLGDSGIRDKTVYLDDLRTAIADHDRYWYGQSEEKELEQYAILSQEKIEGGAVLVGNFTSIQEQLKSELNNCSKKDSSEISITDHCTDIRNHISPLTGVIEG